MSTPFEVTRANDALKGKNAAVVGQEELDDVLAVLRDGARGYLQLAEEVDRDRRSFVEILVARRKRAIDTVVSACAELGYDIEDDGTLSGAFRRGWMAVKDAIAGDGSAMEVALEEDSNTLEEIDSALDADIPEELAGVLRAARTDVEEDLRLLRSSLR